MNALTVTSPSTYDRVENPIAAAEILGNWISKSGMFGAERPEQGQILALQCIVEKMPPLELTKHFHLIGGKLARRSDSMLAGYRERGGRVKWLQFDAVAAKARWTYDGNDIELAYTLEDAKQAGLYPPAKPGSGWAKNPADMLRARLISKAIRMLAPEVCTGQYTPEEIEDFNTPTKAAPLLSKTEPVVAPAPAAVEVQEAVVVDQTGIPSKLDLLTDLLVQEGIYDSAEKFLRSKKWIGSEESITDGTLAPIRTDKILSKPAEFVSAVKSYISRVQ